MEKVVLEILEQNRQLQTLVNDLVSENLDLKRRILRTEQKLGALERAIKRALQAN